MQTKINNPQQKRTLNLLKQLKYNLPCPVSPIIPVPQDLKITARLRVISKASLGNPSEIKLLAKWRKAKANWFPTIFRVTQEGTRRWAQQQLLENPLRISFMIEDLLGQPIGHLGLNNIDFTTRSYELDNVLRGNPAIPGIMTAAVGAFRQWVATHLNLTDTHLRVFKDNKRAVALYRRCGFKKVKTVPLKKTTLGDTISYVETEDETQRGERFFLRMKYFGDS